jgi:hypothetical protein
VPIGQFRWRLRGAHVERLLQLVKPGGSSADVFLRACRHR